MKKILNRIIMCNILSLLFLMTLNLVIAEDYEYLWTNITDPGSGYDVGEKVTVDYSGNVYVTGRCTDCGDAGGQAIYTIKFDANGNHLWTNVTDPTASSDIGKDIAVDGSGNVYVTGFCLGCGSSGGNAIYTIKFDTNGNHLWTNITDPSSAYDSGNGVAVDSSGNVYVTGHCYGCGSSGEYAIYTIKFDTNGNHLWTSITDPATSIDLGYSVAVDGSGNVYVTGRCYGCGSSGGYAIYTMKLDINGDLLWTNITDPSSGSDFGYSVAVDGSGNVYVAGTCDGCGGTGGYAIYTIKFDTNGNHLWTNITDPTSSNDYGHGIAVDGLNNAYVTGYCDGCGGTGGYAIYTIKFDTNGNHLWTNITDPTSGSDSGSGIAVDDSNNAYVTGYCGGCGSSGGNAIYTFGLGSITSLPTYSNFIPSLETTNFSQETNLTDVKNLTLAIPNKGKIKFGQYGIDAEGSDLDTYIQIENSVISVNTSALHSTFNNSATLTFDNVNCNAPYVYYSDTKTLRSAILAENNICLPPRCTNIQCADSTLTVNVSHFSGYAVNGTSNLTIDADDPKIILELVTFTAIYMNSTGFISGAICNISFNDGSYIMDEQMTYYNYSRTFATQQIVDYNVTCSAAGENTVFANDTAVINPTDIPEFSTITLGLGLITILAGLFIIRKKR